MLIVIGKIEVEDGAIDQVRGALATMETETRKESGCLTYAFTTEINSPTTIRLVEQWESMKALEEHFASPHMASFFEALGGMQPKSVDVHCYDVAGEVPLPS